MFRTQAINQLSNNIQTMKKLIIYSALALMTASTFVACQDKSYEEFPVVMKPISQNDVKAELQGDDYVITWNELQSDVKMQVTRYVGNTVSGTEVVDGNKYVHSMVETNVPYTYVLKTTDGKNVSTGIVLNYMREGASRINNVSMAQTDTNTGYDAIVSWDKSSDATSIKVTATNGSRTITETLGGDVTSFTIPDVKVTEEWHVTVVAVNEKGSSLSSSAQLKIGSTKVGYLSIYPTEADLIANGDDDEACAWLWTKAEYKNAEYIYFGNIKSAEDLKEFRVLFWLRDIETEKFDDVFTYPDCVKNATPFVSEWYKNGGSLLLWQHACPYIEQLGRLPIGTFTAEGTDPAVGTGKGWNDGGAHWVLAVSAWPGEQFKLNYYEHPIYRGFDSEIQSADGDSWKNIRFLGPGWREDHNCLFHNLPGRLTGKGNQDRACYDICTSQYGIYPLGTWDGQRWWIGQLNVWEAQQGNTDCKGTIICIGNGGCEFAQNNPDGTKPTPTAYPTNNIYQDNILRLAKNSIEYLKTR